MDKSEASASFQIEPISPGQGYAARLFFEVTSPFRVMVNLVDILDIRNVACHVGATSKRKALQQASRLLSESVNSGSQNQSPDVPAREQQPDDDSEELLNEVDILDALIERERLGSTALGSGVAVPHGHLQELQTPIAALMTLQNGVDFDAPDDADVDIIFALLVPQDSNDDHLAILSQVASRFDNADITEALRKCGPEELNRALDIFCSVKQVE